VETIDGTQAFVCIPDAGVCEAPAMPDPGTVPGDLPVCVDDIFEDNDSRTADLIEMRAGDYANLRLCGDGMVADNDYYPVTVARATELSVSLGFAHAEGDIDLSLVDEAGTSLASSVSITDDEEFSRCLAEGLYYVNVWSIDPRINASYDLSITTGECCLDDARETPGDDLVEMATPVQAGTELRDGQICEMDSDWFSVQLLAGDALSVFLKFDHETPEDDLDMYLYDANLEVVAQGDSVTSHETLDFVAPAEGAYPLRVLGHMGAHNDYQIRVDITQAPPDANGAPEGPPGPEVPNDP